MRVATQGRQYGRVFRLCCLLLPVLAAAQTAPGGPGLNLTWRDNYLTITGDSIPGGEVKVWYIEAYCRPGSTRRPWEQTVIGHTTRLVSAADDGKRVVLECSLKDGVKVRHEITAGADDVTFKITATNSTDKPSQAHWAQPCVRVGPFTGRNKDDYLDKCFVFLDGKLSRMPTRDWAKEALYTPGQVWCPRHVDRDDVNPRPLSRLVPENGLIGCFSEDEKRILALAFEPYQELFQGIIACLHSDFRIGGLEPGETKTIRGKMYLVPNDVEALLKRYRADFPEHFADKGRSDAGGAAPPYVVLKRGPVEAVIVDNRSVDDDVLPGHRAGYSGVASLTHERRRENLFVPAVAGLNFEHIHDGTVQSREILFEPRNAPMELRRVDDHTAELHQPPTPHWGLESWQRYRLLEDGTIELAIECVPRKQSFRNGYVGLFWASYIHQPESGDIHFHGQPEGAGPGEPPRWVRATSKEHGLDAMHVATSDDRAFRHDPDFPLTLVFTRSRWRFEEPWYFGTSHDMAYSQMFRPADRVRFSQSPSGGGNGNPAWDFQFFIPDPQVGRRYRFVMRAAYLPAAPPDDLRRTLSPHLRALGRPD